MFAGGYRLHHAILVSQQALHHQAGTVFFNRRSQGVSFDDMRDDMCEEAGNLLCLIGQLDGAGADVDITAGQGKGIGRRIYNEVNRDLFIV